MRHDRNGYMRLRLDDWPDFAAIKQIEIEVAAGIVRWINRRSDKDFLIEMLKAADRHPAPAQAWVAVNWVLWQSMEALKWLHVDDCPSHHCDLWFEAVQRAYYRLIDGTFDYPSERQAWEQ